MIEHIRQLLIYLCERKKNLVYINRTTFGKIYSFANEICSRPTLCNMLLTNILFLFVTSQMTSVSHPHDHGR